MGTEAAEKEGVAWTVTHKDHPVMAIYANPQKMQLGTASLVSLKQERVGSILNFLDNTVCNS